MRSLNRRRSAVRGGFFLFALVAAFLLPTGCKKADPQQIRTVRVFCAAGFAPVMESIREDCRRDLGIELQMEASGSEVACRKLTELGRPCDLLLLADGSLVGRLLHGRCNWRTDFAADEIVLGVGMRAPDVSEAEKNWPAVLLRDDVRLARANENTAPIGYRTLLVWGLQERLGVSGLSSRLKNKCVAIMDDVERLAVLLKTGEADYGFLYRSTCMTHSIRFIPLDRRVNLGDPEMNYAAVSIVFSKLQSGTQQEVVMRGAPCFWSATVPEHCANEDAALQFLHYLFNRRQDLLSKHGFVPVTPPKFFCNQTAIKPPLENLVISGTMN